jgi:hypothetical protein
MRKKEFLEVLTRFHREVFIPDFQRIADESVDKFLSTLRNRNVVHGSPVEMRHEHHENK